MDANQKQTTDGQTFEHDADTPINGSIEAADFINEKLLAVISYFGFFWVSLFPKHDTKFTRYHANQGLVLAIMTLAFELFLQIFIFPFNAFNAFAALQVVSIIVTILRFLVPAFFILIGVLNALNGAAKPLLLIGKIRIIS